MRAFGLRFLLSGALGLTTAVASCSAPSEDGGAEVEPLVAVKVARAERRDVTLAVSAPAVVHPRAVAQIAARITAPIRSLEVEKGDRVAEGQVVARLEDRDLRAQLADVQAELAKTREVYTRRRSLFEEGAIPERDLLTSKADFEKAEAQLDLVQAQLAFTELRSPFGGIVTEQLLYPGDMARPDAPLFTVMDVAVVVARAQVPENEVGAVRVGQRASFVPSESTGASAEGRIRVVSADVDPSRRTVEVWCDLPNEDGRLHPGAFGRLRIETQVLPERVVVPVATVELEEGSRRGTVLVVDEGGIARRRSVSCGESFDGLVPIETGLEGGEAVVVEGGYGLSDGTRVTVTESATP